MSTPVSTMVWSHLRPLDLSKVGVSTFVLSVALGPDHEEYSCLIQGEEPLEVHISPVHDVESPWLWNENIKNIDIVQPAV